jgi:hypothetical protein
MFGLPGRRRRRCRLAHTEILAVVIAASHDTAGAPVDGLVALTS